MKYSWFLNEFLYIHLFGLKVCNKILQFCNFPKSLGIWIFPVDAYNDQSHYSLVCIYRQFRSSTPYVTFFCLYSRISSTAFCIEFVYFSYLINFFIKCLIFPVYTTVILTPLFKSNSTSVPIPVSQSLVILYSLYQNIALYQGFQLVPFVPQLFWPWPLIYGTLFSIKVYVLVFLLFLFQYTPRVINC